MADAKTAIAPELPALLAQPGPWTTVFTDGRGARPQVEEEARRRALADELRAAGAPEEDIRAVATALEDGAGLPSPSTRYLLARGGELVLDEAFTGARLGPELVEHGPLPRILPLLRHRAGTVPYLVVETAREGARLRLRSAHRAPVAQEQRIEGRTDSLKKVQAGGWSHRRFQMHSEDIWEHTQAEVAEAVDRIVREQRPRFVVIAGDVRARQLLQERLAPKSRDLVVEVEAHTKAEGSDERVLEEAVQRAVDERIAASIAQLRDRAAADRGAAGAQGTSEVLEALQQARVDALLLDARLLSSEDTLLALDGPPWAAHGDGDALAAEAVQEAPLAEALARAALLGGARVIVLEEELAEDQAREDRPPAEPLAALRWADAG